MDERSKGLRTARTHPADFTEERIELRFTLPGWAKTRRSLNSNLKEEIYGKHEWQTQ
jgi:hypothetical protein